MKYEKVEKKVKIDAEIIDSIISGNEFSYIKEWLKLIKFVTKDIDYIECSDTTNTRGYIFVRNKENV